MGWTGETYQAVALCVGGIVCVAAANGGATSQDLKTGYIVGATPFYQQLGLVIGVATSALAIGWTLKTLDNSMQFQGVAHAIGTDRYSAPQATLMATIIKGLLAQDLPWGLVFVGMFVAVVMELCGVNSLSFAVGAYLPLSTTAPIWVGGMMRVLVGKMTGEKEESELSSGMLYSTGLVAGGSLTGILIALLAGVPTRTVVNGATVEVSLADRFMSLIGTGKLAAQGSFAAATKYWENMGGAADLVGMVMFGVLCFLLVRAARQKLEV
jgi:putative OPT family oligopeptide transporter